jgi:predicted dehydrogenase
VNVLVVGLGNMGRNHKRVLEQLGQQVRTLDPAIGAGADYTVLSVDLVEWTDVVCIAAPIEELAGLADNWISRRKHVLVEKPGATDGATLAYLQQRAGEQAVNFAVGYTERHNPGIHALSMALPRIGTLRHISIRRLGYADATIDPALNLACHDFDVLDTLGFDMELLSALRADGHLAVHLVDGGVTASVEASHLHPRKVRKLEAIGTDGVLELDYQRQRLYVEHESDPGPHGGEMLVDDGEPLANEWMAFLGGGEGSTGTKALALAERVRSWPQFETLDLPTAA